MPGQLIKYHKVKFLGKASYQVVILTAIYFRAALPSATRCGRFSTGRTLLSKADKSP